jgi:hypothetical protein
MFQQMIEASNIRSIVTLKMEAASTYKTPINFHRSIRRSNREDSHLHDRSHFKLCSEQIKLNSKERTMRLTF